MGDGRPKPRQRVLGAAGSRRGVIGVVAGALVAGGAERNDAAGGRCRAGQRRCGRRCRNTQTDRRACGGCGSRCAAGEWCDGGRCCPALEVNCGDGCAPACGGVEAARRPFPQRLTYPGAANGLRHLNPDQQADDIRAAWSGWKARYLARHVVDGEVRYWVRHAKQGHADGWDRETVSEGMGYGMILAAHMAGDDGRAQEIFDGLWRFARAHPSSGDPRLMQWRVRPGGRDASDDSAFDGDCDMAFALLLAEAQWGNDGSIDYRGAFDRLIEGIEEATIGPDSAYPLLGDWVQPHGSGAEGRYTQWTTRTSDIMPGHFRAFRQATGRPIWDRVVVATHGLVDHVQLRFSPGTGLLPDFVQPTSSADTDPRPADAGFLEGKHDGHFFYNAGRTPWRLATNALLHNDATSRRQALAMARWARGAAAGAPRNVRAGYTLEGKSLAGSSFFSAFFVAPFGVAAMLDPDAGAEAWLAAVYDAVRDAPQDYYEDSVALLCMLVMTGNWWDPLG